VSAPQGSAAWLAERAGAATCSRFKDVLARTKSGEAATRRNYKAQLVVERLTGEPMESYQNAAMAHGTASEPLAREAYEAFSGNLVEQIGFRQHPTIEWCGGSVDGLVDDEGIIEIKAPYVPSVHLDTLLNGMPPEHMPQTQGLMLVLDRQWCDFISWDVRFPEHLQLYVERVERNDAYIETLQKEVITFLKEVQSLHDRLMNRTPLIEQLAASLDVAGSQA